MAKRKPNTVYSVDGIIVLARSPKGAMTVVKAYGHTVSARPTIAEMPEETASQAINARTGG